MPMTQSRRRLGDDDLAFSPKLICSHLQPYTDKNNIDVIQEGNQVLGTGPDVDACDFYDVYVRPVAALKFTRDRFKIWICYC